MGEGPYSGAGTDLLGLNQGLRVSKIRHYSSAFDCYFDCAYYLCAEFAVSNGCFSGFNARKEMVDFHGKGLHIGKIGRDDVAHAISQLKFTEVTWCRQVDPAFEQLDFFSWINVIVDDHFVRTDNA